MSALRISLTTVATTSASGPKAVLVAMTWLVSWTATPAHSPNGGWGERDRPADGRVQEDRERPEQGDRGDRIGDLAGPRADDRRGGDDRGVAAHRRADRDEQPEPALDRGRGGPRPGRSRTTATIVTTISPVAGSPIRAISPRLSRAPSSTMPRRRTRCEANASPGRSGPSRGPAIAATTMPSSSATETSATIEGRNAVTRRATAATAIAAASPGAIDRAPPAQPSVPRVRTVRGSA